MVQRDDSVSKAEYFESRAKKARSELRRERLLAAARRYRALANAGKDPDQSDTEIPSLAPSMTDRVDYPFFGDRFKRS